MAACCRALHRPSGGPSAAPGSNDGRRGATGGRCRRALPPRASPRVWERRVGGGRAAGGGGGAWGRRASGQAGPVRGGRRCLRPSRSEAFSAVSGARLSRRRCSTTTAKKASSSTSGRRRRRRWGGWAATRCSCSTGPTAPWGQVTGAGVGGGSWPGAPLRSAALPCLTKLSLVSYTERKWCYGVYHVEKITIVSLSVIPTASLNGTDLDCIMMKWEIRRFLKGIWALPKCPLHCITKIHFLVPGNISSFQCSCI